jgi:hypothetical protein
MSNENNGIPEEGRRRFIGAANATIPGAATVLIGLLASAEVSAEASPAGPVKQPAVIGYANNKGVTIERVTYQARNLGTEIVANVFKPPGFDEGNAMAMGSYPYY